MVWWGVGFVERMGGEQGATPAVALAATGGPTAAAAVGPFGFGCGRKRPQPSNMRVVNTPNSLRGKRWGGVVSGAQPPTDIKMRAGSYTNKIGACARGKGLTFADAPASGLASI